MIDRIEAGKADAMRVWGTNPFALTAIAIAGAMLFLGVGCAVLGDPNPCDRTQAMRNALELATGRDCDLITDEDLADVRVLSIYRSNELKNRDFSGLNNLRSLRLLGDELPWDVVNNLVQLRSLDLSGNGLSALPPGVFENLVSLQILDLSENNLRELPSGIFDGLGNLQELYLEENPGDPFDINIGVCSRPPPVRSALEREIGRNCAGIGHGELAGRFTLTLREGGSWAKSRPGDFLGLVTVGAS